MAENQITIASTTASQEELNHAASEDWRNAPAAKEEPTGDEGEAAKSENGTESEPAQPRSKEGKSETEDEQIPKGVKKRIDKYAFRAKTAEEERDKLLDRIKALEAGATPTKAEERAAAAPVTGDDPEPKQKDFTDYTEFLKAQTRWVVRQENSATQRKQVEETQSAKLREKFDAHNERIVEARDKYDDYDESLKKSVSPWHTNVPAEVEVAKAFQLAIIESDNGPDVMHYLAKHPDEFAKLGGYSPAGIGVAIGRISASLLPSGTPTKVKPLTKLNPPAKQLTSSSTSSATPLDSAAYQEFKRRRNAGEG